jgi:hypothetical protein
MYVLEVIVEMMRMCVDASNSCEVRSTSKSKNLKKSQGKTCLVISPQF